MLALVRQQLPEVLRAVGPLIAVASILQAVLVQAPTGVFVKFLAGSLLALSGMVLLFAGIDMGILPMGRFIGAELPRRKSVTLGLGVAFAFGFATTAAEPDVLVLAGQVESVSSGTLSAAVLVYVVAAGVGIFTALALLRVIYGVSMVVLVTAVYVPMILLSLVAPPSAAPLAYDAGSVTTGVLTAPVVLALARGFNSVLAERSPVADTFGFLGMASTGPIIVVLLLGMLS